MSNGAPMIELIILAVIVGIVLYKIRGGMG